MKSQVYIIKTNFKWVQSGFEKLLDHLKLPTEANKIAIKINLCDARMLIVSEKPKT